jgi:hypothetical protein
MEGHDVWPRVGGVLRIIVDSFRVSAAFSSAARGEIEQALTTLNRVGEFTSGTFEVRLLKGALYSHLARHDAAVEELILAARAVKADKRLSQVESNYLVAYAVQYWEYSARRIDMSTVTKEIADTLKVENPIEVALVPARLQKKFPLKVPFIGVDVVI